jgi:hypothetical protein
VERIAGENRFRDHGELYLEAPTEEDNLSCHARGCCGGGTCRSLAARRCYAFHRDMVLNVHGWCDHCKIRISTSSTMNPTENNLLSARQPTSPSPAPHTSPGSPLSNQTLTRGIQPPCRPPSSTTMRLSLRSTVVSNTSSAPSQMTPTPSTTMQSTPSPRRSRRRSSGESTDVLF